MLAKQSGHTRHGVDLRYYYYSSVSGDRMEQKKDVGKLHLCPPGKAMQQVLMTQASRTWSPALCIVAQLCPALCDPMG